MHGLNHNPLPNGEVSLNPNGTYLLQTASGARYGLRPNGSIASYSARGTMITFRPNGLIRAILTPTLDVRTGIHGERIIKSFRSDGAVLVSTGPNRGYMERTSTQAGHPISIRTYLAGDSLTNRIMVTSWFGTTPLPNYLPSFYFPQTFYDWLSKPWPTEISYAWSWMHEPWFSAVTDFFMPDATYRTSDAWLTDYFLSSVLAAAHAERAAVPSEAVRDYMVEVSPSAADKFALRDTPITPELKAALAEQVRQHLNSEAMSGGATAPVFPTNRVFVATSALDVRTSDERGCTISAGNVLRLAVAPPEQSSIAILRVAASRPGDCPAGEQVTVALQDLQEWQNQMREHIDAGITELHNQQSQNNLPAAPPAVMEAPPRPSRPDLPHIPTELNLSALLDAQQRDARLAESSAVAPLLAVNQ